VVRRHRLIELFLVEVMGMSWTEVHDEAEHLEHAVSDRLIERIDEMLGHPETDPHGDPIPDPEGVLERRPFDNLLTCPLHAPVTVRRVTDQDPEFLRFVERRDLKPGDVVEVVERDPAADSVHLRGKMDRAITIGARAASKVLVQAAGVVALLIVSCGFAVAQSAQTPAPPTAPAVEPFQILDNSFLVEEAFNQEKGIVQNIVNFARQDGEWILSFTQEWPAPSVRHQFSYTMSADSVTRRADFGDVYLNYRYQLLEEGPGRPAFAPRVSVIVPSGSQSDGAGEGGLQFNAPFSKQRGDVYFHWGGGLTWLPRGERPDLPSPFLAGSTIYRLRPMLNLMLESVFQRLADEVEPGRVESTSAFTISPGVRGGWTVAPDTQIILGLAVPVTRSTGKTSTGVFCYFSYELPFLK